MSDTLPKIRGFLERTNLPFEIWPCDPELADTAVFCEHYGVALATSRRPIDAGCVVIAAIGILLITPEIGHQLDLLGVLFALGAGAGWAAVILISRHLGKILQGGVGVLALTQLMDLKSWLAIILISSASIITSMVSVDTRKK